MRANSWFLQVDQDGTEKDTMGNPNLGQLTHQLKPDGLE